MLLGGLDMKYKLGDLIYQLDDRNREGIYRVEDVKGLSIKKEFIETKAKMEGVSLSPYKIVKPNTFAYVTVTSRNSNKITLAYNRTESTYIVSSSYITFEVSKPKVLDSEYLFIFFNRPEFDRYVRFNSWGSARETFTWDDICDIEIELPSIEIQKKYVAVYKSMLKNQGVYEKGLEDLKLVCDATIEKLRREMPSKKIKDYIQPLDDRNNKELYDISNVKGLSIQKEFIETKANLSGVSLTSYKIVKPESFAYVTVTSRNSDRITMAYNRTEDTYIVSSSYIVFNIAKPELLNPEYLFMFFERSEFDRYTRFHSWGSARETFMWDDLVEVEIPIPDIKVQNSIVDIYNAYITRMEINEQLKGQINDICPVLIKGSLEEVAKGETV